MKTEKSGRSSPVPRSESRSVPAEWVCHQLVGTLDYARERDYRGWDLYDGESSRVLKALPVENKWLNLVFQQSVRRAPINIRPVLAVATRRDFMGIALFVIANIRGCRFRGEGRIQRSAGELVDSVIGSRSGGYRGV
jgi:hypothetical protein